MRKMYIFKTCFLQESTSSNIIRIIVAPDIDNALQMCISEGDIRKKVLIDKLGIAEDNYNTSKILFSKHEPIEPKSYN